MSFFAIGDLHLPGDTGKTMDMFGAYWEDHFTRIQTAWRELVTPEDTVLLPGDLSWAMQLEAARGDLESICALPGRKILIKGNHDYWWSSISRLRAILPDNVHALQYDACKVDDVVIAGSRGWDFSQEGATVLRREILRVEASLKQAQAMQPSRIIAMMHYPPFDEKQQPTAFTDLFEAFGVSDVVYGHLHGAGHRSAFIGEHNGVRYHLTSCDYLRFSPYKIPE